MSHLTSMKTRFQNLFYLEKSLNKLGIANERQKKLVNKNNGDSNSYNISLLIPQQNSHNIEFCWNGKEYELSVDMSYWKQPYPIEVFINKIAQQYAGEVIIGESKKLGFRPINYRQNNDGSNTLVLERWNANKTL